MDTYFCNTLAAASIAGIERYYTIEEVAAHLNISVSNMRRLVNSGTISAMQIGRQYRIAESDLILFLKQNRGKRVAVSYTTVYITSNIPLEQQYEDIQKKKPETWRAFLRRITEIKEYRRDGTIQEVTYDTR